LVSWFCLPVPLSVAIILKWLLAMTHNVGL